MLHNFTPRKYYTVIEYELVFDDGRGNGFGFPCNKNGELLEDVTDAARENYRWCLNHKDHFVRFNKIILHKYRLYANAYGTCSCGNEVELYDDFCGACQCEKCGKWYNLFGQELVPPGHWEEDY